MFIYFRRFVSNFNLKTFVYQDYEIFFYYVLHNFRLQSAFFIYFLAIKIIKFKPIFFFGKTRQKKR